MEKVFNCIMCPLGCELTVSTQGDEIKVSGNNCLRGEKYAKNELTNPQRSISSLVKYEGGVVPVKTNGTIPKDKISDCMKELSEIKFDKKPAFHEVVISNVCGTGVDIIVCG